MFLSFSYVSNSREGRGRLQLGEGVYYEGDFKEGVRSGEGTARYANGDAYSGHWSQGKKEGQGVYVFSSCRSRLVGDWLQGAFVGGEWKLSEGQVYRGHFENAKPSGKGEWNLDCAKVHGVYTLHAAPIDFAPDDPLNPPTKVTAHWKTLIE